MKVLSINHPGSKLIWVNKNFLFRTRKIRNRLDGYIFEYLFIDDGSTDSTIDSIQEMAPLFTTSLFQETLVKKLRYMLV